MQLRLTLHHPLHDLLDHLIPVLRNGRIEFGQLFLRVGVDGGLGG